MEPTSSAASAGLALSAVAMTSILPGVDGDALIGAFAGAVVFVLHAKDLTILKRIAYMLVSVLIGYMAVGEVVSRTGLESHTLAAFGASAFVVTFALAGIDRIRQFDITSFWKKG